MRKNKVKPFKTWLEISRSSLVHNLKLFRKMVGSKPKILCVVKGNAYGHGLTQVAGILSGEKDANLFGVDNLEEALAIKRLGIKKPILILGYTRFSDLKKAIQNNISFVVYNKETLEKIVSLKSKRAALVHLKIETGLNRQGIKNQDILKFLSFIKEHRKYIYLEGIYTHFADFEDSVFIRRQLREFKYSVKLAKENGFKRFLAHFAATGVAILYPDSYFDAVRIGIGLYGLSPSKKPLDRNMKPVASWKSIVAQVKEIERGESVGYGRTWIAGRKTKIAIVPVGYADGFDRHLSNNGRVLIRGKFAKILGRIMMNMITVDVSGIKNLKAEEEVILIGKDKKNEILAEEIADKLGTISYEVITRINPLLPRIVV